MIINKYILIEQECVVCVERYYAYKSLLQDRVRESGANFYPLQIHNHKNNIWPEGVKGPLIGLCQELLDHKEIYFYSADSTTIEDECDIQTSAAKLNSSDTFKS